MLGYLANKALICECNVKEMETFLYVLHAWLRVPAVNILNTLCKTL